LVPALIAITYITFAITVLRTKRFSAPATT
jgi:hypothetical protein